MKNKLILLVIIISLTSAAFSAVFNRVNTVINTPAARQGVIGQFSMGASLAPYTSAGVSYWEDDYYLNYSLTDFFQFGITRINNNDIAGNVQMLLAKDVLIPKLNIAFGIEQIIARTNASTFDTLTENYINNMAMYMVSTYRMDQFELSAGLGDSRLSNAYLPYNMFSNLFYSLTYYFSKDGKNAGHMSVEYDAKDWNTAIEIPLTEQLNLKLAVTQIPFRTPNNPAYGDIPVQNICIGFDFTTDFFSFYGQEYSKLSGKIKDIEAKSGVIGEKYQTAVSNSDKTGKIITEVTEQKNKLNADVQALIKELKKEKEQLRIEVKALRDVVEADGFKSVQTLKEDIMRHYYHALQLFYEEKYFDSIEELSKAKLINNQIPEIHIRLGSVYWTLGLKDEALKSWREAYALDKNNESLNSFLKANNISFEEVKNE